MSQSTITQTKPYAVLVISLCACYLFYKYVLQIYPSIITQPLMQVFQLTATDLGYLAATFYYTYTIMQIFTGVLIDKYGARWLSAFAIFCCALGAIFFAYAYHLYIAILARGLMGFGVAFATVAYMRIAAAWFPPRHYAFIGGLLATAAMGGAVFGQAPLSFAVGVFGWRACLLVVGFAGLVLAVLFALFLKEAPHDAPSGKAMLTPHHEQFSWKHVLQVLNNKQNWLLTLYNGLAFSPIVIFGGLWGNPFLEQAYHLNHTEIASMVSLVFIGLGIGSPVLGLISDALNDRRNVMLGSTFIGFLIISAVLYCHAMPLWLLSTLLFLFGFSLGSFMLVFTIGKELNPAFLTATVVAMINTSEPILNGLTEPVIGKLLDLTWDGTVQNGVHVFALHSYHLALSVLPMYLLIASVLLLFVKNERV